MITMWIILIWLLGSITSFYLTIKMYMYTEERSDWRNLSPSAWEFVRMTVVISWAGAILTLSLLTIYYFENIVWEENWFGRLLDKLFND